MSQSGLNSSIPRIGAVTAVMILVGWGWGLGSAVSAQTYPRRGMIADNDETARFRIAVAAFEQRGGYGRSSLGERLGDRLARDLERENRELEALDPDDVERRLRQYGLYLSERFNWEQAQRLRAAFHANTLILGQIYSTGTYARAEMFSLRTGSHLATADVQASSPSGLLSRTSELARRLSLFIPLEGFIIDVERGGRFEIDLGSRHGLQRGMRLAILRDEGGYYGFPRERRIGTARIFRVGSRRAEAEVLDLEYGTSVRSTDRVRVQRGDFHYEPPYLPVPPWDPEPPWEPQPPNYPPPYPGVLHIQAWLDDSCRHWRPGDRLKVRVRANFEGEILVFDYRGTARTRRDALGWAPCRSGGEVVVSFRTLRHRPLSLLLVRGVDRRGRQTETYLVLDLPSRPHRPEPPCRPPRYGGYRPGWDRLELRMDKRDRAFYYLGERFSASYRVPRDSYLELWDYRPNGKRVLLVRKDRARGGRCYTVRGTITPPYGWEELVLKAWIDGRVVERRVRFYVRGR